MVIYYQVFFAQGTVDQLYWDQMSKAREEVKNSLLAPVTLLLFVLLAAVTSPQNNFNLGFMFYFPLYTTHWMQCIHTTGAWYWVYIIEWVAQALCNDMYHEKIYLFVRDCSMYAYLSHYLFV